jgi:predicted AlkP superfamily phosphohydrolase/phosphomutase
VASRPNLTVLGFDAATFSIIDPMLEAGQLPNIAQLFSSGTRGVLRSTTHPLTTQAWTTMLTGVNAGKHGMWDFSERDATGYRLRVVNGSFRSAPAVWDFLSARGKRVGFLNVPFTWPAPEVDGFFMAGLDAAEREAGLAHPPGLAAELRQQFGKLLFDHGPPLGRDGYIDVNRMCDAIHHRADLALYLQERYEPELLFLVFMAGDHMQHYGWIEWEERGLESRVAEVYRAFDKVVGRFVDAFGEDANIMIVSDHGAGRMKGVVNINAWLNEHGWLTFARHHNLRRELPRVVLYRLLEQRRKLPRGLRDIAKQHAPAFRDKVHELKEFTAIDYANTQAFAYGNMGNVVLNVRGREKFGIVEPGAEYDEICEAIRAKALEMTGPEGERLVTAVYRRDELFEGPELERLPDLIFEFDEYAWAGKGNLMKPVPMFQDVIKMPDSGHENYVGTHRYDGIIGFRGAAAARTVAPSLDIKDVAPTLMYLVGEPVPETMEGRVLEEIIAPALLESRPVEYTDSTAVAVGATQQDYSADELPEVEARLRNLGYIE